MQHHPEPSIFRFIRQLRDRACRDWTGVHYIEGLRAVLQALDAHIPIQTLVYSEILVRNALAQKRVRLSKRDGVPVLRVTPEQFRSVCRTERASGLGAVVLQHWTPIERADPRQGLCWIALRALRSPGNLGTLIRTAEAVGAAGVIFLGGDADPFDPAVVRGSMVLNTPRGALSESKPRTYQGGRQIDSRFCVAPDGTIGFEVAAYDWTQSLIIDPTMSYSTFLGTGNGLGAAPGADFGTGVAVDAAGYVYVAGWTSGVPSTVGPGGATDAFVKTLSADGSSLLSATYFGGSKDDKAVGLGIGPFNSLHVAARRPRLISRSRAAPSTSRTTAARTSSSRGSRPRSP